MEGYEKQITDIDFEGMSFTDFREIIKHYVHGIVYRLYYCPLRTPLNVGIKEIKTDNDVQEFVRVGYDNKWYIDLYVEHFDYDIMDFINEEANGILSSGSSDEYYSSDECEDFPDVDFHNEGEDNVVIKNLTTKDPFLNKMCPNSDMYVDYHDHSVPQAECEALDDPEADNIDPIFQAKKGVCYPKHDPKTPWNQMTPVLGMRYEHPDQLKLALANYGVANGYQLWFERNDWKTLLVFCGRSVEDGRSVGRYINKKRKIQKSLFNDAEASTSNSKTPKKTNKAAEPSQCTKSSKSAKSPKTTKSYKKLPKKNVGSKSPRTLRVRKRGEGCSTDVEGTSSPVVNPNTNSPKPPETPRAKRKRLRDDNNKLPICGFRLWASWMSTEHSFQTKTLKPDHNCSRNYNLGSLVTYKWIAYHMSKEILNDPFIPYIKMKSLIREKFLIEVSLGQCKRAKQRALFNHEGGLIEHYGRLWDYRRALLDSNPGSTCELDVEETSSGNVYFKRFYICFKGVKEGWLQGCRRIIGLDGCFLKHTCKGELLTAMGRDANNQMYPIAWAVVRVENYMNWTWFLSLLHDDLNLQLGTGLTLISDSHKVSMFTNFNYLYYLNVI